MLNLEFRHGLGDTANFARLLQLYKKYKIDIAVNTEKNKNFIFDTAGVKLTSEKSQHHGWWFSNHPLDLEVGSLQGYKGNKPGANMDQFGLNHHNQTMENLWKEYKNVDLPCREKISQEDWKSIENDIKDWPRPIVLWHSMGNTSSENKSFPNGNQVDFAYRLLDGMNGTLCVLDWDSRVTWSLHNRFKNSGCDIKGLNLARLAALMYQSNLFIGIDSGPFHFSALTNVPSVCVFFEHIHPADCVVPWERALSITTGERSKTLNPSKRFEFQLIDLNFNMEEIAKWILRMLEPRKYLPDTHPIAQDVQLQQIIEMKCRGIGKDSNLSRIMDRNRSFDKLLQECKNRFSVPIFVETGCIRSDEDWGGAGFSTALFGRYCHLRKGKLISFDTDLNSVKYANKWCRQFENSVEIICKKGNEGILELNSRIDVLYLDSLDADVRNHQECNLEEFKAAESKLHSKSLILIDDTPSSKIGKGVKTIEYAKSKGWNILYAGYQVLLAKV